MEAKELHERATHYAGVQLKKRERNPDYPVEYMLKNSYQAGHTCRNEEVAELKREVQVLKEILSHGMTEAYLEKIMNTYRAEVKYSKLLDDAKTQMIHERNKMTAYAKRISKNVKARNNFLQLNQARLANKIDNDGQGEHNTTTED